MKNLACACRLITPICFSYVFVGLAYGILMNQAGYQPIWTIISCALIYAGSMQIVLISLLAAGSPIWLVGLMALLVNARHMFYGIGFVDRFKKIGGWKYPYMALTMTDETYSVLCSAEYPAEVDPDKTAFYVQLLSHLLWIAAGAGGAIVGSLLPFDMRGIEFSATAFFVTVVVNQWRQVPSHIPALTGLFSAVAFYFILGADKFILPALSLSLIVLVVMKDRLLKKGGEVNV